MYDNKYSFSGYKNVRKHSDLSFTSKYYKLLSFYHRLNEFRNLMPWREKAEIRKNNVYENVTKLYNTLPAIYFKKYNDIIDSKKEEIDENYDPSNLFLEGFEYDKWHKIYKEETKSQSEGTIAERVKLRRQKADDDDLSDMPPLESDKEVK